MWAYSKRNKNGVFERYWKDTNITKISEESFSELWNNLTGHEKMIFWTNHNNMSGVSQFIIEFLNEIYSDIRKGTEE